MYGERYDLFNRYARVLIIIYVRVAGQFASVGMEFK